MSGDFVMVPRELLVEIMKQDFAKDEAWDEVEAILRASPPRNSGARGGTAPEKPCTCYPGEAPVVCQKKYAFLDCVASDSNPPAPDREKLLALAERWNHVARSIPSSPTDGISDTLIDCANELLAALNSDSVRSASNVG